MSCCKVRPLQIGHILHSTDSWLKFDLENLKIPHASQTCFYRFLKCCREHCSAERGHYHWHDMLGCTWSGKIGRYVVYIKITSNMNASSQRLPAKLGPGHYTGPASLTFFIMHPDAIFSLGMQSSCPHDINENLFRPGHLSSLLHGPVLMLACPL